MPKKVPPPPPFDEPNAQGPPVHTHQWRASFNPDGSVSQVCDCGARRDE